MLQIGGSIAGGDGHSSLCLGLVVAVGVDARLERDPERLLPRGWGKVWEKCEVTLTYDGFCLLVSRNQDSRIYIATVNRTRTVCVSRGHFW